ncbi:MAG: TraR/DksA family transcriptional regulator [Anaerolineae bacterium]
MAQEIEKARLEEERKESLAELARLKEELRQEIDHGSEEGDPDIYERERTLALVQTLERKVESIEYALRRMEKGDYGICERCGAEIGTERLKVVPETTLCVSCKAETEKRFRRASS